MVQLVQSWTHKAFLFKATILNSFWKPFKKNKQASNGLATSKSWQRDILKRQTKPKQGSTESLARSTWTQPWFYRALFWWNSSCSRKRRHRRGEGPQWRHRGCNNGFGRASLEPETFPAAARRSWRAVASDRIVMSGIFKFGPDTRASVQVFAADQRFKHSGRAHASWSRGRGFESCSLLSFLLSLMHPWRCCNITVFV